MNTMKQDELIKLGHNIRRVRKSKGLNQTVLANRAKTRPTTISSLENGNNPNPGWDLLDRIAKVLNASIHDLTQPEVNIKTDNVASELTNGLKSLLQRQDELLGLSEPRISLQEVNWLAHMPIDKPDEMSPESYLMILRHYRLIRKHTE
ncbi:helix-turn-helix transcriptional regulator [bacterium]|nr:helix-turn-helix transcriptional regulator [candidate division CSSED10-310 bacterium]